MAANNRRYKTVKDSQRRITYAEFTAIQNSLRLNSKETALLTGLSLSAVDAFRSSARQKEICGAPATTAILLLKFLAENAPGTFSRVKEDFHAWAFAYKEEV